MSVTAQMVDNMSNWVSKTVCRCCFKETCYCQDQQLITTEQRWVVTSPKTMFRAEQGVWEVRRESLSSDDAVTAASLSIPLSLSADILQHTISIF